MARNRRARHDYSILDTYECGIALVGAEVKSLREGHCQIGEAFAQVDGGEVWLFGMHIPQYAKSSGFGAHDPDRKRKLLLHRKEIAEIEKQTRDKGITLVPLEVYFHDGRAKVALALAKGRRAYDKRHAIAARDAARDAERELRRR